MVRLDLNLLGAFQLRADGRLVRGLTSSRLQSLLSYLALHRDAPQPRQRLAFLLWPDTTEGQARTNLRKTIHFLRRTLPVADILLDYEGVLQWNPEIPFSLDTAEFEAAVRSGEFEQAVALYTDDLLPNCYDEWILADREQLKQMYLSALECLVQQKEAAADYPAALSYARRLLQNDPLCEESHRLVMRIYALNGDRAAVLHAYQNCTTLLKQELGVEPSPSTSQLYERLLYPSGPQSEPLTLVGALPLIGRTTEWSRLLRVWREAIQGKPQMALITGEAGIGKTRLAEELLVWVNRQGISCASAHCYEMESGLAYAPVTAWLRDRPLSNLEPVWQVEVARLIPELVIRGAAGLPISPITESWQRQRFHEAMARAVLAPEMGMTLPLLLLIEDLQWCDRDTLEWLHYLMRFNARARFLVLATLRKDAAPNDSLLHTMFAGLRRQNLLTEIELGPLCLEETAALGQRAAGHALDADTSRFLYAETEGNPLFVIEFARSGLAKPAEISPGGRESVLPPRVQAAVAARLMQLTPSTRKVMEVAATIGRDFTYDVLARASGEGEDILIQALDELWRRRMIREQGKDCYDFSHDKLRQVAYSSLSPTWRRWLHKRVAQALSDVNSRQPEAASGQIGWHYEQAGEEQVAAQWLHRAGEAALKVGAFSDAVAYLTHALELTPITDIAGRYALLLAREKVYHLQSAREAQAHDLAMLEELASAMDDGRPQSAFRKAQAAVEKGYYLRETSDFPGAIATAQRVLAWIGQAKKCAGDEFLTSDTSSWATECPRLEVEAYELWGTSLAYQGNYPAAIVQEEKALGLASAAGLRREEARALSSLAYSSDSIAAGKNYLMAALLIYREIGDKPGESACLEALGYVLVWGGDFDGAVSCYEQSLQLSRQIGFRGGEVAALFRLGHFYNQVGDYSRGKGYLGQALSMAHSDHDQRRVAYGLFNISVSENGLGQAEAARNHALEALGICREIGDHNGEINAWIILGDACKALEQWDEAAAIFQQALDLIPRAVDPSGAIYCQAKLAVALLEQGKADQAIVHVEEILAYQEHGGNMQGTDEGPIPAYMDCYRILQANGDPRAQKMLQMAHSLLQEQVSRIKNEAIRQSFVENKPANRELMEAWKRRHFSQ